MNQRTSNTLFLGSVIAGVALVALMAPPASATEPAVEEVCTDTICITAPAQPVLELAPANDMMLIEAVAITADGATYTTTADIPSFQRDMPLPDTVTVLGKIEQDDSSAADALLGTDRASMPDNFGDLNTVDSVTGVGIVSTF